MSWLLWGLAYYLVIGVLVTWFLSQTPYSENAWWVTTLLWPLWFAAFPGLFVVIALATLGISSFWWFR